MKPKLFLLAAAFSSGIAFLHAEDAPKPPQGPGGDPQTKIDEMFKRMDTNGDGKISKDEFIESSKKEAEMRFNKLDASGSGFVTKEQLTEAMRRMRGGEGGPRRPEGFNKPEGGGTRPRPGDDKKAPEGNPPPADGGQGGPPKRGEGGMGEIFRKIQENGSVTKEDFAKMSEERFKLMDTNGDGKITKEELEEAGKKMREMRGAGGDAPKGNRPKPAETN